MSVDINDILEYRMLFYMSATVIRCVDFPRKSILCAAELGDGLGSLGDSVLGEFTRKHKTDGCLDFSGGKSGLFVVGSKLSSFGGDSFENVIDEGVHDGHSLLTDTGIRVHLLQHLVDV